MNIDDYIDKITAEIKLLDNKKLEDIPFDERLNKQHDDCLGKSLELLRVLKELDDFIEDTIIKPSQPDARVVKERYDDLYTIYAEMLTGLYNDLKDNPNVIQQGKHFDQLLKILTN